MKNHQKGFIVPVLLVIIALLVIGGGVYVYKNQKAEMPTVVDTEIKQQDQVQQQTNTKTSLVNTQTEISNWKTYAGTNYIIKYPSDWHTRSVDNTVIISSYIELSQPVPDIRAKIEINNYDNPKKLSSKEWYIDWTSSRQDPDTSTETQSMTIDGIQAYLRIDNSLSSEDTVIYLVNLQRDDKMYSFWVGGNKKFEQTLLQILFTFKFTK